MSIRTAAAWGAAIATASAGLFAVIWFQDVAEVGVITRDPAAVTDQPWYLGAASSLGAAGWAAAASIMALGALVLRREARAGWPFLATGATVSVVLLLDDLYLGHEHLLPRIVGSEKLVLVAYAVGIGAWILTAFRRVEPASRVLLATSAVLLGTSLMMDVVADGAEEGRLIIEDGLKFAGIWTWVAFSVSLTLTAIDDRVR